MNVCERNYAFVFSKHFCFTKDNRLQVFDGKGDCSDWSDECPKQENVLASLRELIGNPFLRTLVWIMGLLAILGNAVSHAIGKFARNSEENCSSFTDSMFLSYFVESRNFLLSVKNLLSSCSTPL